MSGTYSKPLGRSEWSVDWSRDAETMTQAIDASRIEVMRLRSWVGSKKEI